MELQRSLRGSPDQKQVGLFRRIFTPPPIPKNHLPRHNSLCSSRSGIPPFFDCRSPCRPSTKKNSGGFTIGKPLYYHLLSAYTPTAVRFHLCRAFSVPHRRHLIYRYSQNALEAPSVMCVCVCVCVCVRGAGAKGPFCGRARKKKHPKFPVFIFYRCKTGFYVF